MWNPIHLDGPCARVLLDGLYTLKPDAREHAELVQHHRSAP